MPVDIKKRKWMLTMACFFYMKEVFKVVFMLKGCVIELNIWLNTKIKRFLNF